MKKEGHPIKAVMDLSCIIHRAVEQQMADLGLTTIQSRIMRYLYLQSQSQTPVFQRELEEEFKIRRSSVTSVVQMLERKGLIRRVSVSGDARQKELVLTEQGVEVQRQVFRRMDELDRKLNEVMTEEEQKIWLSCISKMETRLKEAEYD